MRTCLFLVPVLLAVAPASARMLAPSACSTDLSPAAKIVSETVAKVEMLAKMRGGKSCAAYQDHFLVAVRARDVIVSCRHGAGHDPSVARLDAAIDAINSGIAENCGLE